MPRIKGAKKKQLPPIRVSEDLHNKMYLIYGDPISGRFQYGKLSSITEKLWREHINSLILEHKE